MDLVKQVLNKRYKIEEKIGEGTMSRVYLARDLQQNRRIVLKVLKEHATSQRNEDLIRFRNETVAISRTEASGVVDIHDIGETEGFRYIAVEYVEGESLEKIMEREVFLKEEKAVEIVYQLALALRDIHQAGVIHRDLKPANVIVKGEYLQEENPLEVKVIDFGLARLKEFSIQESERIAGTLYYMSPEQSGAVKRNVDERSDLYSLGVIFYQLLTGEVPFYSDNLISIIHQHIARVPEYPSFLNSGVSPVLDRVILKLLEKEPEKRYQSASVLLEDLDRYRRGEYDFLPGVDDRELKINLRTDFVGRETELYQLKQAFFRLRRGEGGICMVEGEAGTGKSRLVEEFRDFVLENRGVFVEGKGLSGGDKSPYVPFKDALSDYLNYFTRYPLDQQKEIMLKVQKAIGDLGRVLFSFSTLAGKFLEDIPPLVELEPERESRRFHMVISKFFFALGYKNAPLVLALEDMQWSDESTFELLREMAARIGDYPVLIILVSRKTGESREDRMRLLAEESRKHRVLYAGIELGDFTREEIKEYISLMLKEKPANIEDIASIALEQTGGNPLFIREFIKQMLEKQVIRKQNDIWVIFREEVDPLEIKSSLVDILLEQLSSLDSGDIKLLSMASVIGREFEIRILSFLSDTKEEEVIEVIDRALRMQLLKQHPAEKGKMIFAHDRLKEVLYEKLGDPEKKEMHFKVAGILEELYREQLEDAYFDLAYHYTQAGEKEKAIYYSYQAGLKAGESYAGEEALSYLHKAVDLMEEGGYYKSEEWYRALESMSENYLAMGYNDEAVEVLEKILEGVEDNKTKVRCYQKITRAYYNKGDWVNCPRYACHGLRLLGEKVPENNWQRNVGLAREILVRIWRSVFSFYYDLKKESREAHRFKEMYPLFYFLGWAYALSRGDMYFYTTIRYFNLTEKYLGLSREKAFGIDAYATLHMVLGFYGPAEKYLNKAMKLKGKLNDRWGIARYYQWRGYLHEWAGNYEKALQYFKESLERFQNIGDMKEVSMCLNGIVHCYYYTGSYERMKEVNDRYLELSVRSRDTYCQGAATIYNIHYYRETGNLKASQECGEEAIELTRGAEDRFNFCSANIETGITLLEKGEIDRSVRHLEEARYLKENNNFLEQYTVLVYPYLADAYISRYLVLNEQLGERERKQHQGKIKETVSRGLAATRRWPAHRPAALRAGARKAFLEGSNKKARKLYQRSIDYGRYYKRNYEAGRSLYEYGVFLKDTGHHGEARENLEEAYRIFKKLGAKLYESRAASMLGLENYITSTEERFTRDLSYAQRLLSIIELSREISSLLELEELLDKITSVAIEVSGAQKGFLILKNEKTGKMEVQASRGLDQEYGDRDMVSSNIVREVEEYEQPVLTSNALGDEKFSRFESVVKNELKSIMCVPLKYQNEVKGACYLVNNLSTNVFTEEDLGVLEVIMGQAAISIENAKLYEQAITDDLTGLFTLKHFKLLLQNEIEKAIRHQRQVSVVMMDIDNFRQFNNTYGHQLGDLVLMKVAEIARTRSRSIDILARYGGEEFIIFLPETGVEGARVYAEKLREAVEESELKHEEQVLKVTVSQGIATYPDHVTELNSLISAADRAMYQSKRKGKNRVSVYGE